MARNPFASLGKSRADSEKKDTGPTKQDDQDEAEKARKAKKAREAKKAKGEEDSDDEDEDEEDQEDEEDEADPKAKAARARERARIGAIMSSAAARRDPVTAMHLCVDTATPRGQAIKLLGSFNVASGDHGTSAAAGGGRDHLGNPLSAAARRMIAFAKGRTGDPKPEGRADRGGPDLDAQGRPVSPAAQAMIDAGRKRRGEG